MTHVGDSCGSGLHDMEYSAWIHASVAPRSDLSPSFVVYEPFSCFLQSDSHHTFSQDARCEPAAPLSNLPSPCSSEGTTAMSSENLKRLTPEDIEDVETIRAAKLRRSNPVVVPNLTKKARGRQVPTNDVLLKAGRTFACKVEDCRKVFTRAEHLKRHIRSIHTNEKPFKCEHPQCEKSFTRHDNLLQHQRNHRAYLLPHNTLYEYGPLERVQTFRCSVFEPPGNGPISACMGVLLPSPLTSTPLSYPRLSDNAEVSSRDGSPSSTTDIASPVQPPYLPLRFEFTHAYDRTCSSLASHHAPSGQQYCHDPNTFADGFDFC